MSQTGGGGSEVDRTEVATPTFSAIELAENPLDRRALVSLKKQLEIDQPTNKLLTVSSPSVIYDGGYPSYKPKLSELSFKVGVGGGWVVVKTPC